MPDPLLTVAAVIAWCLGAAAFFLAVAMAAVDGAENGRVSLEVWWLVGAAFLAAFVGFVLAVAA